METGTLVFLLLLVSIVVVYVVSCLAEPTQREPYSPYGYTVKYGNPNEPKPQIQATVPPFPAGSSEDVTTRCHNGKCTHTFGGNNQGVNVKVQMRE